VNPPEICAPVSPSMPSGFSRQSMYGVETSSSSSTIAKWWDVEIESAAPRALSEPRWAMLRVVSWNSRLPLFVNSMVTMGKLSVWLKFCSGFLMSVPESAGLSLTTHHASGFGACLPFTGSGRSWRTIRIPSGTLISSKPFGIWPSGWSRHRASDVASGRPLSTGLCAASNPYQRSSLEFVVLSPLYGGHPEARLTAL
jgi:hypothetical protein